MRFQKLGGYKKIVSHENSWAGYIERMYIERMYADGPGGYVRRAVNILKGLSSAENRMQKGPPSTFGRGKPF